MWLPSSRIRVVNINRVKTLRPWISVSLFFLALKFFFETPRNYHNSHDKCKWPYNVALYGHTTKRYLLLISVVLVEIRVFCPFAFGYGEQRTALCFFVWPVVEPGLGLEHPEADDVLTAMGF